MYSDWLPVTSGVPQGSILGPLMFLLYINDMPSVSSLCTTALFADDVKCFKEIKSQTDSVILQNHLDMLYNWSINWKMSFNVRKCKVLSVTRAGNTQPSYTLNGSHLEHVGTFKDLGVIVDTKLSWRPHIDYIVKKANRVCGMVKRSVGYNAPSNAKLQLYKALCRPNIEYSSQVWSPYHKDSIKTIESVQKSMSRYIGGMSDVSYSERCKILNILPLSYRRVIMDYDSSF